jgi:hypothetical protein
MATANCAPELFADRAVRVSNLQSKWIRPRGPRFQSPIAADQAPLARAAGRELTLPVAAGSRAGGIGVAA